MKSLKNDDSSDGNQDCSFLDKFLFEELSDFLIGSGWPIFTLAFFQPLSHLSFHRFIKLLRTPRIISRFLRLINLLYTTDQLLKSGHTSENLVHKKIFWLKKLMSSRKYVHRQDSYNNFKDD